MPKLMWWQQPDGKTRDDELEEYVQRVFFFVVPNLNPYALHLGWVDCAKKGEKKKRKIKKSTYYNPVHRCHRDNQRLRRICSAVAYNMSY